MSKKWMPRRFGEHKRHANLHKMLDSDLYEGDILLVKEWSNTDSDVRFIRLGQAMFSHIAGGSSNTEHALINCRDGSVFVIESLGDGLNVGTKVRRRDHVVYSCTDDRLRSEACFVAERLADVRNITAIHLDDSDDDAMQDAKREAAYMQHKSAIKYRSGVGMAASVFRSKKQWHFADKRLRRLYEIVYEGKKLGSLRMICSEFVASCYEVAALHIEKRTQQNPRPFGTGIDPRGMSAKAFEAVLQRPNTKFRMAGSYFGTEPLEQNELATLQRLVKVYIDVCKEAGQRISVDDAFSHVRNDRVQWVLNKNDMVDLPTWKAGIAKAYQLNLILDRPG